MAGIGVWLQVGLHMAGIGGVASGRPAYMAGIGGVASGRPAYGRYRGCGFR